MSKYLLHKISEVYVMKIETMDGIIDVDLSKVILSDVCPLGDIVLVRCGINLFCHDLPKICTLCQIP